MPIQARAFYAYYTACQAEFLKNGFFFISHRDLSHAPVPEAGKADDPTSGKAYRALFSDNFSRNRQFFAILGLQFDAD